MSVASFTFVAGSCDDRLTLLPHGAHYALATLHGTFHSYSTMPPHYATSHCSALPQSYLRYTFLPARPRVNEVSKSSPYPGTTVPITSADSSAFDSTVSGTCPRYCEEGWVFRRIVGVLFDNIVTNVTCHCCDYSKKEMSSPVVRDLPCSYVVCLYFLDVQLNLS